MKRGAIRFSKTARIYDGKHAGIAVSDDGKGTFVNCDLYGNRFAAIAAGTGGNPTVRNCRIHDGGQVGVWIAEGGKGTFEGCVFEDNAGGDWLLDEKADEVSRSGNVSAE